MLGGNKCSCYETAGAEDIESLVTAMRVFHSKSLLVNRGEYTL